MKDLPQQLIQQLSGNGNTFLVPAAYVKLLGSHTSALFLNQVIYWSGRTTNPEGWIWKTHEQWREELLFSEWQFRNALQQCKDAGIIHTENRRVNGVKTTHMRVDFEALSLQLYEINTEKQPQMTKEKASTVLRNSQDRSCEILKTDFEEFSKLSITEIKNIDLKKEHSKQDKISIDDFLSHHEKVYGETLHPDSGDSRSLAFLVGNHAPDKISQKLDYLAGIVSHAIKINDTFWIKPISPKTLRSFWSHLSAKYVTAYISQSSSSTGQSSGKNYLQDLG